MVSRVLVPMNDSEMAERALEYALEVHHDAEIVVLAVVGEPSAMWGGATTVALADDVDEAAREEARPVLDRAREIAGERGVDVATRVALGHPTRAILEAADEFDAVVMGAHAGSLADRLFVGDVAGKVVRHAPVPVTVVR